jgi:hypothetical protein
MIRTVPSSAMASAKVPVITRIPLILSSYVKIAIEPTRNVVVSLRDRKKAKPPITRSSVSLKRDIQRSSHNSRLILEARRGPLRRSPPGELREPRRKARTLRRWANMSLQRRKVTVFERDRRQDRPTATVARTRCVTPIPLPPFRDSPAEEVRNRTNASACPTRSGRIRSSRRPIRETSSSTRARQ